MLEAELRELERTVGKTLGAGNTEFFTNIFKVTDNATEKYLNYAAGLGRKSAKPIENQWRQFIHETDLLFSPWMAVFLMGPMVNRVLSDELKRERLTQTGLIAHFDLPKPTLLIKQDREAAGMQKIFIREGLGDMLNDDPAYFMQSLQKHHPHLAKKIKDHLEEYEWVGTHHCWGDPLSIERLMAQIKEALPASKPQGKRRKISKRLSYLIGLVNEFAYWRQFCAECSVVGLYKARGMLSEAARRFGMGYDDVIWLTKHEILAGLGGGKMPTMKEISGRRNIYGHLPNGEGEEILVGNLVQKMARILVPKFDMSIREFAGTVGSKGKATGRAFVAFTPKDALPMQKGQILVVPQTTPDYVVVMKKAAAIVTDEGGITCHAAIVSRELGTPCIVGTKQATHVIKTGEMIEVDANKGIIRRLGR